jgi:hypothetical protein
MNAPRPVFVRGRRWMGAVLAASLGACDRGAEESVLSQPVADTTLRRGKQGIPSVAVDAIVEARCAREQRCNNVGTGRAYPSLFECSLRVRAEWAEDVNRVACERGVDEAALGRCLRALSNAPCSDLEETERQSACRPLDICDPRPEPPPEPLAPTPAIPG